MKVPLFVKFLAIVNEPEFDAINVALAAMVKLPLMSRLGSLVSALTITALVPSPIFKSQSILKLPEGRVKVVPAGGTIFKSQ